LKACGVIESDQVPECNRVYSIALGYNGVIYITTSFGELVAMSTNMEILAMFDVAGWLNYPEGRISNSFPIMNDTATGNQHLFVAVNEYLVKVVWSVKNFSIAWVVPLGNGTSEIHGRLGIGIGSTPSVMGEGNGPFYIVTTDGEVPMNIHFVDTKTGYVRNSTVVMGGNKLTASEQSVVVSGYRAVVVNNYFEDWVPSGILWKYVCSSSEWASSVCRVALGVASYGVEQFNLDPATGIVSSVWVNNNVSCASSIPVVSEKDEKGNQVFYCIGARNDNRGIGITTLEAIDWQTGNSLFSYDLGKQALLGPAWSATEVGPNGDIYYGALGGLVHIYPQRAKDQRTK